MTELVFIRFVSLFFDTLNVTLIRYFRVSKFRPFTDNLLLGLRELYAGFGVNFAYECRILPTSSECPSLGRRYCLRRQSNMTLHMLTSGIHFCNCFKIAIDVELSKQSEQNLHC